jgi:hypothetical protein
MPDQFYDYEGSEFDWFLVDGKKRVALCSSAGFGDVPLSVLDGLTEDKLPTNEIPKLIEQTPELGGHEVEGRGPGKCIEFRQMANRGFFVFDWKHWKGPYERILVPEIHLTVGEQGIELPNSLRAVCVDQLNFERINSFQVADLGINFVARNTSYIK